jgi:hypothetical protein
MTLAVEQEPKLLFFFRLVNLFKRRMVDSSITFDRKDIRLRAVRHLAIVVFNRR